MTNEYREFSSYRGLDRVALFMGIPLIPAVFLLFLGLIFMFVGAWLFDIAGFLFAFLVLPVAFLLRIITETDDMALQIMFLEFKYRAKRVCYNELGQTLAFMPERYYRYEQTNEQQFISIDNKAK